MITGNYGLWNAYVLVTMVLYLPYHEGQCMCPYTQGGLNTLFDMYLNVIKIVTNIF